MGKLSKNKILSIFIVAFMICGISSVSAASSDIKVAEKHSSGLYTWVCMEISGKSILITSSSPSLADITYKKTKPGENFSAKEKKLYKEKGRAWIKSHNGFKVVINDITVLKDRKTYKKYTITHPNENKCFYYGYEKATKKRGGRLLICEGWNREPSGDISKRLSKLPAGLYTVKFTTRNGVHIKDCDCNKHGKVRIKVDKKGNLKYVK